MKDIEAIIQNLRNGPDLLEGLLRGIPAELLKAERKKGKWTIHAHACHLAVAQPVMLARLKTFIDDPAPVFKPYFPDREAGEEDLLGRDLRKEISLYREHRARFLEAVSSMDGSLWHKEARHPEYEIYTPYIMTRHIMMHDYLHMYRIEELWLTRDAFL